MRILITDITDMKPGMHCVAGWCESEKRMVRPMPDGNHWSEALIARLGLEVGSTIEVAAVDRPHVGSFPHTTEDLDIFANRIGIVDKINRSEVIKSVPPTAGNLSSAFEGYLRLDNPFRGKPQKLWVPVGAECRSLVGMNLPSGSIVLSENRFDPMNPKLRATIVSDEGVFQTSEVTVSCSVLKGAWRSAGLAAARYTSLS
jgi:hypothetical protein